MTKANRQGPMLPSIEAQDEQGGQIGGGGGPWDPATLTCLLLFVSYLTLLDFTGFFHDWQELQTEPYFLLHGLKNYTDIATHHAPLLTEFLALLYRFFGTDILVRQILLILATAAMGLLVLGVADQISGRRAGQYSLLLLAILWPFYGGTNFWFDSFLPLFYAFSLYLIVSKDSSRWLFLAGSSMGLAFLVKQVAGPVALVTCLMLIARTKPTRERIWDGFTFSVGVLSPILIMGLWYGLNGQLQDASYWMILYNLSGPYVDLGAIRPPRHEVARLVLIASPVGVLLISAAFSRRIRRRVSWEILLGIVIGFFASFTIIPRWERWHVAPSVPFLVLSTVFSLQILMSNRGSIERETIRVLKKPLLAVWMIIVIVDVGTYFPPMLIGRFAPAVLHHWPLRSYAPPAWYDEDMRRYLRDIPAVGAYVREATEERDTILVWGWMGSRLYFESQRLPTGRFYYALPWFTCLPQFKEDLVRGFEEDPPRLVIILKRGYPGTPELSAFGIHLEEEGYVRVEALKDRFPGVTVWEPSGEGEENLR